MFKTILVHLRGTKGDSAALATVHLVARPFAAHLECLHVRPDLASLVSRALVPGIDESTGAISEMLEALQSQSSESAQRAADAFSAFCTKEGVLRAEIPPGPDKTNAAFRQTTGDELQCLIEQSRYHDLVVVKAGYEEAGGLYSRDLGRQILSAGRPVLLAPNAHAQSFRTVIIAWKDTPEAARAVAAAMPLLQKAQTILVVTANENDERSSGYESVVRQLSWHGLAAEGHNVVPGQRDASHAVLEIARAANADLLVMGAYGHSRLTETVLGGFTQGVLDDSSIPVFMMH